MISFHQPIAEQQGEDGGEGEGDARVGFDEHVVVEHAADGDHIDEAVETLPAPPAEPFDHRVRRGDGERHEQ